MDAATLGKLIQEYGLGIALVIVIIVVWILDRVEHRKTIEKKDSDYKELQNKVIEMQEKTIASNDKLANNIQVNTEATRKVDSHLETAVRVQEGLVQSVNAVLSNVRRR